MKHKYLENCMCTDCLINKNKTEYIGCKSWSCHSCKHYIKFLSVASMQDYCWNRKHFFEPVEGGDK